MHLYVVARGIKPHLDKWQNDLLAQWVRVWKDGKPMTDDKGQQMYLQLAVRPIQLYEIVFPKEELETVMNISGIRPGEDYTTSKNPMLKRIVKLVRKSLKLKDVPPVTKPFNLMQPHEFYKSVSVMPIGLKDDDMKDGFEQI